MDPAMKSLIAERAQVKGALTRFYKFYEGIDDSIDPDIIASRLAKAVELLDKFESVQAKIECLCDPDDAEETSKNEDERERFETLYHLAITKVKRVIKDSQPATPSPISSATPSPGVSESSPLIRLPTISLPTFNGERDQWVRFRESFESLIHNNDSLSGLQKFHYLNSVISGAATRTIRSLGISEANYASAWQSLKGRFEDPNTLIDHHTKALFELPVVSKPSHTALRQLIDDATNHLSALKALGEPTIHWGTLLLRLLSSKLDNSTKNEWKRHSQGITTKRKFGDMISFLEQHCRLLEDSSLEFRSQPQRFNPVPSGSNQHKRAHPPSSLMVNFDTCPLCKGKHRLAECEEFVKLSISARRAKTMKLRVCFNCLQTGHSNQNCTRSNCRKCGKNHHTLVHLEPSNTSAAQKASSSSEAPGRTPSPVETSQALFSSTNSQPNLVLLSTAMVYLRDSQGNKHECRALLDQGSQTNFITEQLARKLKIPVQTVNTSISGIGRASHSIRGKIDVSIASRINAYQRSISCLIISKISEHIPNQPFDKNLLPIPNRLSLADPDFSVTREVDLLIGGGLFWDLICIGQHKLGNGLPVMQKTHLGWVLAGELNISLLTNKPKVLCHLVTNNDVMESLQKFWEIEEITSTQTGVPELNPSDPCEAHFASTTTRDSSGRYVVNIPFTHRLAELGNSREIAEKRLHSIERKLGKTPALNSEYCKFMREYEELGHMSEIPSEQTRDYEAAYYLPHHAVFKVTSTTTKLRVVFDGSAKSSSGLSLNDVQRVGPTVQDDLFSIALRLREKKFIISGDIAKMYRQVLVTPDQRRYQRILWLPNPSGAIRTYQLNTITYGTASASYLATRALRQLGEENAVAFPAASRAIIRDFYVDDLLTGADTLEEARQLKGNITDILAAAGFELRKWASNDPRILHHGNPQANVAIDADKDPKTLGLLWNPDRDILQYSVQPPPARKISKRSILSEIAQIFDPLGLVGPAIIQAKMMMQKLWELRTSWDESLPMKIHTEWLDYRSDLLAINQLIVPRPVLGNSGHSVQLHAFCDASEKAYGASVYLRAIDKAGNVTCHLLCAKSRVAPLKTISLPRLELSGALLLIELVKKVKSALTLTIEGEHYWTDSTITLSWIRESPSKWRTFVANRVTKIQNGTCGQWRHVSSSDNPADIISRGIRPSMLGSSTLWWHGPSWLLQESQHWPESSLEVKDVPEMKSPSCSFIAISAPEDLDIFNRFSCVRKLFRVIAYCFRFYDKLHLRSSSASASLESRLQNGSLSVKELARSEDALIRIAQRQDFAGDISQLSTGRSLPSKSHLLSLNPFLDKDGLLRVGGRLNNAPIPYEHQHPVILHPKHPLTILLIQHEHARLLHAGCQAVMASLRIKYWPISLKNAVKAVLRKCIRCFRTKPKTLEYLMGALPADRVSPSRPFSICGVDYAGPFYLKEHSRARVAIKAYLCVFVCFSTKAVHLELATDMTTNAFLNCLKRFIARRGKCRKIYSDNGSNFIGARNELHDLGLLLSSDAHNNKVNNMLGEEGIDWLLIPPGSPNFGGLWESAVKSAKFHLKRVVGETRLTFEELCTILTQIESCLNSRPLCALSNDPTDHSPLTPGHFLIGEAMAALPDPDLREVKLNRLTRFQLLQNMVQHFWSRWQSEYLHQLQQRHKWKSSGVSNIQPGTLIIIREDNTPPLRWRMGRIVQLHPGKDEVTRVVSIKTASGIIKRPLTKVCVLPCLDDHPQ